MFFLYLSLWLLFSTKLTIEIAVAGVIISSIVYWFTCLYMRHKPVKDLRVLRRFLCGLKYLIILVWETAKANIAVLRIVFSKTIKIDPCLKYFHSNLKTNAARVALANSLTLTPGTITVSLENGVHCIHCLNSKMAEDIEHSIFISQLKKLED